MGRDPTFRHGIPGEYLTILRYNLCEYCPGRRRSIRRHQGNFRSCLLSYMRSRDAFLSSLDVRLEWSMGDNKTHHIHSMGGDKFDFLRCDGDCEMSIFSIRRSPSTLILRSMDGDLFRDKDRIRGDIKYHLRSLHSDRSFLPSLIGCTLEGMGRIYSVTRIRNGHDMGRNQDDDCEWNKLGN